MGMFEQQQPVDAAATALVDQPVLQRPRLSIGDAPQPPDLTDAASSACGDAGGTT